MLELQEKYLEWILDKIPLKIPRRVSLQNISVPEFKKLEFVKDKKKKVDTNRVKFVYFNSVDDLEMVTDCEFYVVILPLSLMSKRLRGVFGFYRMEKSIMHDILKVYETPECTRNYAYFVFQKRKLEVKDGDNI